MNDKIRRAFYKLADEVPKWLREPKPKPKPVVAKRVAPMETPRVMGEYQGPSSKERARRQSLPGAKPPPSLLNWVDPATWGQSIGGISGLRPSVLKAVTSEGNRRVAVRSGKGGYKEEVSGRSMPIQQTPTAEEALRKEHRINKKGVYKKVHGARLEHEARNMARIQKANVKKPAKWPTRADIDKRFDKEEREAKALRKKRGQE